MVKKDADFVITILSQKIISVLAVKLNFVQNLGTKHYGIKCENLSWNT